MARVPEESRRVGNGSGVDQGSMQRRAVQKVVVRR